MPLDNTHQHSSVDIMQADNPNTPISPTPGVVDHDDLQDVTSDQHHAQAHASSHSGGGADALDFGEAGDISASVPGDTAAAGSTGEIADAGHRHSREAAGAGTAVAIEFIIDGGGSTITTGVKGDLAIPFGATIVEWTILGDQSGSIVIDLWKDTYGNFPPVVGDFITASAKPTVTTATKNQSSTLTGWTTTITAGDTLRFNVDSVTSMQRVTISLKVTRT